MEEDDLTDDEMEELKDYFDSKGVSAPKPEEKLGIFNFFNKVLRTRDTTKVSNLDDEELRAIRLLQSTALYAENMGLNSVSNYLKSDAEILLGSADSKKGFLINAIITQKKEMKSKTPGERRSSWFKKKQEED